MTAIGRIHPITVPRVEQAGAIVVRAAKDEPRILLVTGRRNPRNWIFPKGHIEEGETRKDAALREAREEAGVDGIVAAPAGTMSFEFGANRYRVHYYVVTTSDDGKEREGRRLRWCRYKQALNRLTFDEARDLLRKAWPRIQAAASRRRGTARKVK
jgi:8-oxo-dGTP pyrophosphatase MutT (NUDIX family)